MPRRIAASATRLPILPRPMIPSVCPGSSEPANCFLPSSTCPSNCAEVFSPRTKSRGGGRWRAASSMPARTSSFTALAFAPGALNTGTPRFDSAATGMLFTPAPARPTALREGPNSCPCRSAERTRMASGSFASFTTAYCSAGKRFRPTWAMLFSTRISHFLARPLAMLGFEFLHVLDEPLHAFERHGVVDRGAHAADRAVALQLHHAALLRALEERIVELCIRKSERHVHPGAVFPRHRIPVEAARIEEVVQQRSLFHISLFKLRDAALLLHPLEHQPGNVDRIGGWCVEHRIGLGLPLVIHDRRRALRRVAQQVLAHDDDGEPCRPDVFLRAGVDQAELRDVKRPGKEMRC